MPRKASGLAGRARRSGTKIAVMRYRDNKERRAVILMVVLSLLTLFAIVGITFVLYADAEAVSARIAREAQTAQRADLEPELALALFLSQFIYDAPDTVSGAGSALRGHSLARTMYGYNYSGNPNIHPFNGVGRLHYANAALNADDYTLINYTWFSNDGFVRDPEHYGARPNPAAAQINPYVGGNAPYTYPDLNNCFLAAVTAGGQVLTPSFHRAWLFNPGRAFNDVTNPNWTNRAGKYLTLRPRPAEHPTFPYPDDAGGDVKNLVWAQGGNDSIWIDIGAPVLTAPDGTKYKPLFAPLIMDLDNRINLGTAGNILGPGNTHVSNMGWGGWEANLGKVLYADGKSGAIPPNEWINLFRGKVLGANTVYGKYGPNGTPAMPGFPAPSSTLAHVYAQGDVNGLNETAPISASSRPAPPGFAPNVGNPPPSPIFPQFLQGYVNGGIELVNHPLLYNMFQPPGFTGGDDRVFRASDMEALLRPHSLGQSVVDTGSSALMSDLLRLCPANFGPSASSIRYRNLVTTQSWDLGAPAVSPYWWNGMPATGYLTRNANPLFAPMGQAVTFPPLLSGPTIGNVPGTNPITSEFGPDWRALSANTMTYLSTTNPAGYTSPGARIRLNRALPPYPHMGSGTTPPYQNLPPNAPNPTFPTYYGQAYNLTNVTIASQYQAALSARQALANDIYRRLLAVTGVLPVLPANVATPLPTDLAPRRWLAQLAVNIVDFIDEDDISTPFNFYTTADGLLPINLGATTGGDDPGTNPANFPYNAAATNNTGANPLYWVFGTEMPKVILNEVLVEALNPNPSADPSPIPAESVKVWIELFNTMPTAGGANTQPQDNYRVPLFMTFPGGGTGYSPYRVTIAQTPMHQPPSGVAAPIPGATNYLSDTSSNVLGKAYIGNAYSANPPGPLPQSTTDRDFSPTTSPNGVPLSQDLSTPPLASPVYQPPSLVPPGSGNTISAGVDPQSYFLIGPKSNLGAYQNPFVSPGLPNNTPVLQTDSLTYTPTAASWPTIAANDVSERTAGLTVMLRRLANPYLPLQVNPALPYYNPYVTVDYIPNVPIQSIQDPPFPSRGKTQPYASYTHSQFNANGVAQAQSGTNAQIDSPVINQAANPAGTPPGATTTDDVTNTFGYANYPLPPSGHYDWLVHLDRAPISPIELLHVSAWPPYMLTQRFMLGSNNPANALNMFGHYAPWLDAPPPGVNVALLACPWWFDVNLPAGYSHRLHRLFEFLECGDRAFGVNGLGRIPGKVNINTIWDPEILQALIDANMSMNIASLPSQYPPNVLDPIVQIFNNMIQSRSPSTLYNSVGPVNMGTAKDDRPFVPLSAGSYLPQSLGGAAQFPNGLSVVTDTLLRMNPTANTSLLFQNPSDNSAIHPYLQTQLVTKLYNNITTRSNTFALFLTVGFFQVTDATTMPPTLGPEVGRSEGRQVRHRMFAIVDRTNLALFATSGSPAPPAITVTGPTPNATSPIAPYNPAGTQTILLPITVSGAINSAGQPYLSVPNPATGVPGVIQAGTQLVVDAGTALEETIAVTSVTLPNPSVIPPVLPQFTANFTLPHGATISIIQRGNPGSWISTPYDPRKDPLTVPYYSIID
jgi:hypothetical protein